jgi:sporulation integral membrane protein YtvI
MIQKNELTKKQKRILVVLTACGTVYLGIRFLLPVLLPFLISFGLASLCEPVAEWVYKKCRCPKIVTTGVVLLAAGVLLIFLGSMLLKNLAEQVGNLVEALPTYERIFNEWLMKVSGYGEKWFHIEKTELFEKLWGMLTEGLGSVQERIMPWVIDHGGALFSGFVAVTTVLVLIQVAVLLCVRELEDIRRLEKSSLFAKEIQLIKKPIVRVGKAYLKTEFIILAVVIGELMLGLSLMGNRYSMLLGLLIGILDALPLFGTGTVLIPWTLVEVLMGDLKKAAMVAALYLVCYFTRQLLEPRLMGNGTGLTPLESLIAIYVGLKLFGLWGLFLGPIAWLLVKECVNAYAP